MHCGITYNWVTRLRTSRVWNLVPQPTLGRLAHALETDAVDLLYAAGRLLPDRLLETAVAAPNVAQLEELRAELSDEHARNLLPVVQALVRLIDALEPDVTPDSAGGHRALDQFSRRTA